MDADDQSRIATLYRMDMLVSTGKRKERDATGEAGIEHTKVYCCTPQNLLASSQRRSHTHRPLLRRHHFTDDRILREAMKGGQKCSRYNKPYLIVPEEIHVIVLLSCVVRSETRQKRWKMRCETKRGSATKGTYDKGGADEREQDGQRGEPTTA